MCSHFVKLKEFDIHEIRAMASVGVLHALLAREYGVSAVSIGRIVGRKSWKWVQQISDDLDTMTYGIDLLLGRPRLMSDKERALLKRYACKLVCEGHLKVEVAVDSLKAEKR